MASSYFIFFILLPFVKGRAQICSFDAIYQLGDSTSDTGNFIIDCPVGNSSSCALRPYGTTFFPNPTGRCSDGLQIIDYFAKAMGLHFINPWKNKLATFENGVNFAVSGATALTAAALSQLNVPSPYTNRSLDVQIQWMREFFKVWKERNVERSLFVVGPIGGNDYDFAIFTNKNTTQVKDMVGDVVASIGAAVEAVIEMGAMTVVVPGSFPTGCFPYHLSRISNNKINEDGYDQLGCLKWLNDISIYHNEMLKNEMEKVQQTHANVTVLYSDYYNAFLSLLNMGGNEGFGDDHRLKACCGMGGEYNFSMEKICGSGGVKVCSERMKWVNWDGIHLTQAAHRSLAIHLLPPISQHFSCHFNRF